MAFASQRNKPWDDMTTQLEFMWHELQTTESAAWAKIQEALKTGNLETVVTAIRKFYERPGEAEAHDERRVEIAKSFAYGNTNPLIEEMRNKPRNSNVVYANDSETIMNREQTKILVDALNNGGGGQPINIVVNAVSGSGKAIADAVITALDGKLAKQRSIAIS
jgi:hypothetical protein